MNPRNNEQTLRQKTVEGIKNYMEYHKLNPGDRLPPERQMAKQFGISRTIVRDAVNTLAGVGILEVKHRSGIYITSVDSKTLASQLSIRLIFNRHSAINLFQVRQVLETAVARWAAERCDQDGENKLRKLMQETRQCLSDGNMICFREIDSRFHILLAEISKNPIVVDLIKTLLEYMQSLRHFFLSLPAKIEECARQHEIIFEAVCDRSPGRASAAMEEHLQAVLSAVTDNWDDFTEVSERIEH